MPTAYLPDEDQGIMMVQAMLPANSTLEQADEVLSRVRNYFLDNEKEAVESVLTVSGISFSGRGQNAGLAFVKLRDWDLRNRPDLKVGAVAGRAMGEFSKIRNAMVFAFAPPAVFELGQAKGFDFQLLDRGGLGHAKLMEARNQLLGMAAEDPVLTKVRPNGLEDVPEYRIDVDWEKAGAQGVPISSIHNTIAAAFGSAYVNDFIQGGRVKRVYVQADAPYRMLPTDLERLHVRNTAGRMVPFSSFASGHWTSGSPKLERFNGFPSINILGEAAPGRSSGEAMRAMEGFVRELPLGIGYDWQGLSYQERMASSQAPLLYAFSIFVIFLCLAALYESWPIPISILLVLPLGVIGGVIASSAAGTAQRRLFPDRSSDHPGSDHQERHPDRPVRQGRRGAGDGAGRGHPGGGEAALPPDHHDLAGLRIRRAAAGRGDRCRGGGPECHRHGRAGGHGDGHGPGDHLCAPFLRADRDVHRQGPEG